MLAAMTKTRGRRMTVTETLKVLASATTVISIITIGTGCHDHEQDDEDGDALRVPYLSVLPVEVLPNPSNYPEVQTQILLIPAEV